MWFKRHLNLATIIFLLIGGFILGILSLLINVPSDTKQDYLLIFGLPLILVTFGLPLIVGMLNASLDFIKGFLMMFGLPFVIFIVGWMIHQKGRAFWFIFLLLIPLGWIIPLCLKSKKTNGSR